MQRTGGMQVIGNLLPEKRLAAATCLEQCSLLRVNGVTFREVLGDVEAQRAVAKKVGPACRVCTFLDVFLRLAHPLLVGKVGVEQLASDMPARACGRRAIIAHSSGR